MAEADVLTRKARDPAERETPTLDTDATPLVVDGAPEPGPNEETAALVEAKKALDTAEAERDEAARRAAAAEADRQRAISERDQARTGQVADRVAALTASVDAATSDKKAAGAALKAAREAQDIDAEIEAQDALSAASARHHAATAELDDLKARLPKPGERAPAADTRAELPAPTQQWFKDHPRYYSDARYKAAAEGAHFEALALKIPEASPAYFDHINRTLEDRGFEKKQSTADDPPARQPSFSGARPERTPSNPGGSRAGTVQTPLGPVERRRTSDGRPQYVLPPPGSELRQNFEDGARIAGMKLADYVHEQVTIAEEMAAGGNAGMVRGTGEVFS